MAVPNLLRVVLHYSGYGEEGALSWHFQHATAHSEDDLNAMLANIDDQLNTDTTPSSYENIGQFLTNQQHIDQLSIYQYAVSNGPATGVAHLGLTGHPGQQAVMYGPLQTCAVVSLHTGAAGRRNRGRQYWPGMTMQPDTASACAAAGTVDARLGYVNAAHFAILNGLTASPGDVDIRWCVYSRAGDSARDVTSISMDNKLDTQRRREASLQPTHTATLSTVTP